MTLPRLASRSRRATAAAALLSALAALTLLAFLGASPARAQAGAGGNATTAISAISANTAAPREAAQFDFLLGQWELEVTPKLSGLAAALHGTPRLIGIWKAWRAFDGFGVEDELRIVDASANPLTLAHSLRVWDARNKRWTTQTLDVYRARFSASQGQWLEGEMRLAGQGHSPDGKPTLTRSRFHDITPNGFRLRQDRSSDDGATWDEAVLTVVARRTKAPR